jgi:hypothetical protein
MIRPRGPWAARPRRLELEIVLIVDDAPDLNPALRGYGSANMAVCGQPLLAISLDADTPARRDHRRPLGMPGKAEE